jgi:hypothetical protein
VSDQQQRLYVRFDAEISLPLDELPPELGYEVAAQAVQDAIGHTGAVVIETIEHEVRG